MLSKLPSFKYVFTKRVVLRKFTTGQTAAKVEIPGSFTPDNNLFKKAEMRDKRERMFHQTKQLSEIMRKKMDVINVEEALLEKQKVVIHPLRMRHELDTLDFLHSNREVPLQIYPRDGMPAIEAVIHYEQVKGMKRLPDFAYRPVYVKIGEEEIRCIIDKIVLSPDRKYYFKVYLTRYIVGQPNIVKVEMIIPLNAHEGYSFKQLNWLNHEVKLICYNNVYPLKIELDYKRLARNGKVTFGDLQNILPRGLELLPKHKSNLGFSIVTLEPLASKMESDFQHRTKMMEPEEVVIKTAGVGVIDIMKQSVSEIVAIQNQLNRKGKPAPEKSNKVRTSFKQGVKEEQARLKVELEKKLAKENVLLSIGGGKGK